MRLSKKSAHRIIVSMGLVAPIVYLFGSLFFALNGAHGVQLFADDPNTNVIVNDVHLDQNVWVNTETGEPFMVAGDYATSYKISLLPDSSVAYSFTNATSTWRVFFYSGDTFLRVVAIQNEGSLYDANADSFRICSRGNDVSARLTFTYSDGPSFASSVNFSDYIFAQFFAKDNFLKQWGMNTLSDNPVGFAPFATFIKFFDTSLIHGADSQIALMMYGQLYYMLHIMLFDLVYHVLVFMPNLITSVFNKFGGGLNDE